MKAALRFRKNRFLSYGLEVLPWYILHNLRRSAKYESMTALVKYLILHVRTVLLVYDTDLDRSIIFA